MVASAKELSFKISAYVGRSLQTFEQTHYEYVKVSVPLCWKQHDSSGVRQWQSFIGSWIKGGLVVVAVVVLMITKIKKMFTGTKIAYWISYVEIKGSCVL